MVMRVVAPFAALGSAIGAEVLAEMGIAVGRNASECGIHASVLSRQISVSGETSPVAARALRPLLVMGPTT